ncbi:TMEM175 family protein [Mucilaginibacter flavus]|uniref:TMEM175 family protein n=1 Tax=Mucilaginibacter flavus TaxID=931504 RepID=UPI0025B4394D|nr:TMEM175 family protein [Mucilaginibacter flavus]MDN3583700.1 TMEM175 family protein [Mucilaginibacter flavus]
MRSKAAKLHNKANSIEWRSHEPSRIETFSDAVFAFALTLIIVSIEVPKSFDELMETMKGTISFGVCFALLFQIWNNQNIYFRRYALNDRYTILINAILLFVVLVYTYPLKFLSMLLFSFSNGTYVHDGHELPMIREGQTQSLMLIYGAGFLVIYLLFYLMYRHAKKHATDIGLNDREIFDTQTVCGINFICMCICAVVMLIGILFPSVAGPSGFLYCTIPIAYTIWFSRRGKKSRSLFGETVN